MQGYHIKGFISDRWQSWLLPQDDMIAPSFLKLLFLYVYIHVIVLKTILRNNTHTEVYIYVYTCLYIWNHQPDHNHTPFVVIKLYKIATIHHVAAQTTSNNHIILLPNQSVVGSAHPGWSDEARSRRLSAVTTAVWNSKTCCGDGFPVNMGDCPIQRETSLTWENHIGFLQRWIPPIFINQPSC